MTSPGTSSRAAGVIHLPSRITRALIAKRGLQGGDGVARLVFFPEPDHGVGQKQNQDDAEVRPMPGDRRQDHRRFDHPRDRAPEIAEEFQQLVGLLFLDLVGPVLGQPFLRLGLAEAVRRRPQFLLDLRQRQSFQIVLRIGFRARLRRGFGFSLRLGFSFGLRDGSLGLVGFGIRHGRSFCLCYAAGFASVGIAL